eukprot:scaffold11478_cov70-Cylindrotheca_fusiformis.AAC.3
MSNHSATTTTTTTSFSSFSIRRRRHSLAGNNHHHHRMGRRCALCFFGLPRSYKTMVLPSIQKNILQPNAQYHCDVFVHYYYQTQEEAGRFNTGGIIDDPDEILLLQDAVTTATAVSYNNNNNNHTTTTTVRFVNDTNDSFFQQRQTQLDRYETTMDSDGIHPAYYPWKEDGWKPITQVNMIRQWHSIERAFYLMEQHAKEHHIQYSQVAMLRNDVMYLTPIDIMKLDNNAADMEEEDMEEEMKNHYHFVLPPFGNYPVNDRMIYGPYEAVKIWATKRFELIEERVQNPNAAGKVLHSERFLNESIIPAIQQAWTGQGKGDGSSSSFIKHVNPDICFVRTRVNSIVMLNDCLRYGTTRGIQDEKHLKKLIEGIYGKQCYKPEISHENRNVKYLKCPPL